MADFETVQPYEIVKIATGRRTLPALIMQAAPSHWGRQIFGYAAAALRKDGQPSGNARRGDSFRILDADYPQDPALGLYAPFDATRESHADVVRGRIAGLRRQLEEAQAELFDLYLTPAARDQAAIDRAQRAAWRAEHLPDDDQD